MSFISYFLRGTLTALGLILALVGLLSVAHTTPVHTVLAPGVGGEAPAVHDPQFNRIMELYTGTHLSEGNRVEVLLNGDSTYERMWDDIRSAKQSIIVQAYFAEPGKVADSLQRLLIDRARAGVRVAVLLDAFGAASLKHTKVLPALRAAGIRVAWLRPIRWYTLNRATTRSHSRLVAVDGRVGYTGGFGIADEWLGDGAHDGQWRETNVRFEGPAVAELQAAFATCWAEATGVLFAGDVFASRSAFTPRGTVVAGLMHTVPSVGSTAAERFVALTIAGARRSLYITNSYFVPNQDFRTLLKAAARRGVDVRVLTVGEKTDVKTTWYAGRAYYEDLLAGGVRIFEYQPSMIHAKTIVADGMWSAIGSMNFDNRSMAFNNETNLVASDSVFGARMDSVFVRDCTSAREMRLATFRMRGAWERMLEWGAEKVWRVL